MTKVKVAVQEWCACLECASAFVRKRPDQSFCSTEHRMSYWHRIQKRQQILYNVEMEEQSGNARALVIEWKAEDQEREAKAQTALKRFSKENSNG